MGDRELTRWVSNKLHDVLGCSDSATAFARKMAKSRKGPAALLEGLAVADVPTDNATSRAFAKELMSRLGGETTAGGGRPLGERGRVGGPTNAELLRQSMSDDLVSSEDKGDERSNAAGASRRESALKLEEKEASQAEKALRTAGKKSRKAAMHIRRRDQKQGGGRWGERGGGSSSEDDTVVRPKRVHAEEPTPQDAEDQALEPDWDERDALVERAAEKDKRKTKQIEVGGLTPAQMEPTLRSGRRSRQHDGQEQRRLEGEEGYR